jgi:hypothetical protein
MDQLQVHDKSASVADVYVPKLWKGLFTLTM